MPTQYFSPDRPMSLGDIQGYIGAYASPEAAESDTFFNAKQGRNLITDRYKALTGDPWSDPYEDARQGRQASIMKLAENGFSIASGGGMGPRVLAPPIASLDIGQAEARGGAPRSSVAGPAVAPTGIVAMEQAALAPRVAPVATAATASPFGFAPSLSADRDVQRNNYRDSLEARTVANRLAAPEMQLPSVNEANPNYLRVLRQRFNAVGAGDLFDTIDRNNPEMLMQGASPNDPRFAKAQGGKIEAADVFHKISNDPDFRYELQRNPTKAKRAYFAATNGRDYDTDQLAQTALYADQRSKQDAIIKGIANPHQDPTTGEWMKMVQTIGPTGSPIMTPMPLDDVEQAIIRQRGGLEGTYGIHLPSPALNATGQAKFQELVAKNREQGMGDEQARHKAHTDMYEEQKKFRADQYAKTPKGVLATLQPDRGKVARTYDAMTNFLGTTANWMARNSSGQIGKPDVLFHIPTEEESQRSYEAGIPDREAALETLKRLLSGNPEL